MKKSIRISSLIILSILFAESLGATNFFLSPCGNNQNNGLSPQTPWQTLQKAADEVQAGDTVIVAGGNYQGFHLSKSGKKEIPIIFSAPNKNAIIHQPNALSNIGIDLQNTSWIQIEGFYITGASERGIRASFSNNIQIRDCIVDGTQKHGILAATTDDLLIEGCIMKNIGDSHGISVSNKSQRAILRYNIIHNIAYSGIQMDGGIIEAPTIHNNKIYECGVGGGAALNLDGVNNAFIYNNLLFENHATGIALFSSEGENGSPNAEIINNTVINASDGRWCILINNQSKSAILVNNILFNHHPWRGVIGLEPSAAENFKSDYNILLGRFGLDGDNSVFQIVEWQDKGYDRNPTMIDNLSSILPNWQRGDYRPTNSSKKDGLPATVTRIFQDLDCNSRIDIPDIGCYEARNDKLCIIDGRP